MTGWLRTRPRAESFCFGALVLLMVAPLVLTILLALVPEGTSWARWLDHPWLRNRTFMGYNSEPSPVPFSWAALRQGTYQESLATLFNHHYAGREMMVRWTDEAWFRLFNQPSTKTGNLAVGRHGWLFQKGYLQEYFLQRVAKKELEPMVDDIRKLQDICRGRGMGFLVLVSPSKAATYPEETPEGWDRRYDPRPRAYGQMMELFREKGVVCVDGDAITRAKGRSRALFPIGGIHWTAPVALEAANAVIAELRRQGLDLQEIKASRSTAQDPHGVVESDLLDLMNLAIPWHSSYTVITPHLAHTSSQSKPSVVIVGGSFTNAPADFWSASWQFSSIRCYFYYKEMTIDFQKGGTERVMNPVGAIDFDRDIFQANCLVLELNEMQMMFPDNHVKTFVRDALAHLPEMAH